MAAKSASLQDVMIALRLLASTDNKECGGKTAPGRNSFDDVLNKNLMSLQDTLVNDIALGEVFSEILENLVSHVARGGRGHEGSEAFEEDMEKQSYECINQQGLSSNPHIRWLFVRICLRMLCNLRECLKASQQNGGKGPPVDLLSVSDQKVVSTILQLVVVLGICPNLEPGVGVSVERRSGFSHVLNPAGQRQCSKCLHNCVMTLVKCLDERSLSMVILSRHFIDILSALLQLTYQTYDLAEETSLVETEDKQKVTKGCDMSLSVHKCGHDGMISQLEREQCLQTLTNIVDRMYQPLVVRELLFLQGSMAGSKNMNRDRTQASSAKAVAKPVSRVGGESSGITNSTKAGTAHSGDIMAGGKNMSSDGTQASSAKAVITSGSMASGKNSCVADASSTKAFAKPPQWMREVCGHLLSKCLMKKNGVQNVLRGILESAPGTSVEWKICEAIAQLIANCPLQIQSPDEYYESISPQVLGLLCLDNAKLRQQYSRVAVQTIHAMLRRYPDLATKYIVTPLINPFLIASGQEDCPRSDTVVREKELSQCIESLHKIFVACPDANQLVLENIAKITSPMFELFCFTRHGVSHLRTSLLELLSTFLKRSDEHHSFLMLYVLTFSEKPSNISTKYLSENSCATEDCEKTGARRDLPDIALMKSCFEFQHGDGGGVVLKRSRDHVTSPTPNILRNILTEGGGGSETRILCLVEILENLRKESVPGRFFLYLLEQVPAILLNPSDMDKIRALMIFQVLALMCEKLGPAVLKNTSHMISFIEVTLARAHHVYMERMHVDSSDDVTFELETITMALGMLSALLSGAVKVEASDYVKLESLSSLLRKLCEEHVEDEVREVANDLLVVILAQGAVWSERSKEASKSERSKGHRKNTESYSKKTENSAKKTVNFSKNRSNETERSGQKTESSSEESATALDNCVGLDKSTNTNFEVPTDDDFDATFEQLCDPLLPARGHALMKLAGLLKARNPKALEKIDVLVKTFQDSLIHEDSYIYLAAIEGLVAAADVKTAEVLPYLVREFVTCHSTDKEVLQEDLEKGVYAGCEAVQSEMKFPKRSAPTRIKIGEALLRATKRCGALTPHYFKTLLQAFLTGVKDEESYIRASSLSNLGDVCRLSPQTVPSVIHEIFHCVSSVLKCDRSKEVRQAACLLITLIFRGLGTSLVKVLGENLKGFYQLLKLVESSDSDETTRLHAQVALGELDDVMKEQLFPRQRLVKHITILP